MSGNEDVVRIIAPFKQWVNGSHIFTTNLKKEQIITKAIPTREVRIKADESNAIDVQIGSNNLDTSNSTISLASGTAVNIRINNLNKIYILGAISESIQFSYII